MPLERRRIRAVLFDIDGTLNDTDDLWVERVERILSPIRFAFPGRQTKPLSRNIIMAIETPGNWLYHGLDAWGLDRMAGKALQALSRQPAQPSRKTYRLIPGVGELLECLSQHFPLGVVSSRDEYTTLAFLDAFHLRPFFKAIATSQTCPYTKPYPDPVIWAAGQLGVTPQECLMIGDTTVDIHAGRSAGAQTIGVLCGFGTEGELRRAGADVILPTTSEVLGLLL